MLATSHPKREADSASGCSSGGPLSRPAPELAGKACGRGRSGLQGEPINGSVWNSVCRADLIDGGGAVCQSSGPLQQWACTRTKPVAGGSDLYLRGGGSARDKGATGMDARD